MTLEERIEKLRDLIAQRDEIDRQIEETMGERPNVKMLKKIVKVAKDKQYRPQSKASKDLGDEIEGFHKAKDGGRTEKIEKMIIAGKSVAEIVEAVDVSGQTVYNIKNRLKKQNRL